MTVHQKTINTDRMSARLRERAIDVPGRRVLISRLEGSEQERDLAVPTNCGGFGRIRHFRRQTSEGWPPNSLPIDPACKALGLEPPAMMEAQVFQNAACAWRCWYCFVPYNLLSADPKRSAWLTTENLVNLYRAEGQGPLILDLSGGSPDLVPEWTLWMMDALHAAGLDTSTFLWTDDNLSTTYLFDEIAQADLDRMGQYRNYGRVCCFKGFDSRSFAFNTRAAEGDFEKQFAVLDRLLAMGLDVYGYITLTAPAEDGIESAMERFFDRLQAVDPNFPLRTIPLEIREFSPMCPRLDELRRNSMRIQQRAIEVWNHQISRRYDASSRALNIADVPLASRSAAK
jgi:uncharacterized Fe-S cluster-containing radical SAM superfamily protein